MRLEVHESGTGDALVVFVHGVLDRGGSFRRTAAALDGECRMLWYDRRGYGKAAPGAPPAGVGTHIGDLLAVLEGRRAVVVGHSFGGVTAMGAAVKAPDLVQALVLYETGMAWVPGWDDGVMADVLARDDPEDAALRLMLGPRYDTMGEDERARRRRDAGAFLAEERSVRTGTAPYDVAAIQAPVVYGRGDAGVMRPVVDHLRRHVPQVDVVTIAGAGHYAHRDAPEAFAGLVRQGIELASTRSSLR
jgi:pimeloyl-ACP methyl ester carboxylesterase